MKKGNSIVQNEIILAFLRKNRKNLTSEQICNAINLTLPKNQRLTTIQVSKCLNRFSERNMVTKIPDKGTHSTGRLVAAWRYAGMRS